MVTPEWPDRCPCGGWPNDPGAQIPEFPNLYNHRVLTHQIAESRGFWAVEADLPRVETLAEKQGAALVRIEREGRRAKAWKTWHDLVGTASPPALSNLLALHEPRLSYGGILTCRFCIDEHDDYFEWPCHHWTLLGQLVT